MAAQNIFGFFGVFFMSSKPLRSFSRAIWSFSRAIWQFLLYDVETAVSQLCGQSRATPWTIACSLQGWSKSFCEKKKIKIVKQKTSLLQ